MKLQTLPLLCLLVVGALGAAHDQAQTRDTELSALASAGDALHLWRRATAVAAAAVVEAVQQHDAGHTAELRGADLADVRISHGQTVSLALEADGQAHRYVVGSEEDWKSLAQVLPATQGGLLPRHDWDAIERDWLSPVSQGSVLPDFALEGPLDIALSSPAALQLFLPHASDAGVVQRVLLRDGAAVMVRGARSVRLRRAVDLPAISLSEFAGIVTSDAEQRQPLGVLHLAVGVRTAAAARWNGSHSDQTLGAVALELDPSPLGAALLAAPAAGGGPQRLRVRRVKQGVIELLPRDGQEAGAAGAVAVARGAAAAPRAWPLASLHPAQLQAYERLLRQLISSRLFRLPRGTQPPLRLARDVQLRLLEAEARAVTLLQLTLELERRPRGATAAAVEGVAAARQQQRQRTAEAGDEPPDTLQLLASPAAARLGPHETWLATLQVRGDARRGTLAFVPLHMQRVGAAQDTVQFAAGALESLGMNSSRASA